MKTNKIIITLIMAFMLLFVTGCKKEKDSIKSSNDLNNALNQTIEEYKTAQSVNAKISLISSTTQNISVKYNIENEKISSLATILTDSEGEVSVYVLDGICYISRYNAPKEKYTATDDELKTIADSYKLDAYIEKALEIFNVQFFNVSTCEETGDNVYKLTCDLDLLQVADDIPDDEIIDAEAQVEKLKEMESITLTLTLSDGKVSIFEGTFVKDGATSTIKIEFLGTNASEISVPNASEYTEKAK